MMIMAQVLIQLIIISLAGYMVYAIFECRNIEYYTYLLIYLYTALVAAVILTADLIMLALGITDHPAIALMFT